MVILAKIKPTGFDVDQIPLLRPTQLQDSPGVGNSRLRG
jgi:hypothetical protein